MTLRLLEKPIYLNPRRIWFECSNDYLIFHSLLRICSTFPNKRFSLNPIRKRKLYRANATNQLHRYSENYWKQVSLHHQNCLNSLAESKEKRPLKWTVFRGFWCEWRDLKKSRHKTPYFISCHIRLLQGFFAVVTNIS